MLLVAAVLILFASVKLSNKGIKSFLLTSVKCFLSPFKARSYCFLPALVPKFCLVKFSSSFKTPGSSLITGLIVLSASFIIVSANSFTRSEKTSIWFLAPYKESSNLWIVLASAFKSFFRNLNKSSFAFLDASVAP